MIFNESSIKGVYLIDIEPVEDERGFFARSFCRESFDRHGLDLSVAQSNISLNHHKGTIRGMHFQSSPHEETKLVRCTMGSIYDVVIDLREESDTYLQWMAVTLTAANYKMLYIPKGVAHGFQTLTDNTEVFYQMGQSYQPGSTKGVRWDDPVFSIKWPLKCEVISEKDANYLNYFI